MFSFRLYILIEIDIKSAKMREKIPHFIHRNFSMKLNTYKLIDFSYYAFRYPVGELVTLGSRVL